MGGTAPVVARVRGGGSCPHCPSASSAYAFELTGAILNLVSMLMNNYKEFFLARFPQTSVQCFHLVCQLVLAMQKNL